MSKSKEIELNFCELTPSQYGKALTPPVSSTTIVYRCKQGLYNVYQTEGGHWRIKVPYNDAISKKDYDRLKDENTKLRTIVDGMKSLADSIHI